MSSHPFYIVDVFAETKYSGNQLAVVLDAGDLDTATMQRIARETNFSETTFVTRSVETEGGYPVRIFTPTAEVPFAGHPTLGTAWVIRRELAPSATRLRLALRSGAIPVRFDGAPEGAELLWMRQRPPEFGPVADTRRLAPVVGLTSDRLLEAFPPRSVSTGLPF